MKVNTAPSDQINDMVKQRVDEELKRLKAQPAPMVVDNTPAPKTRRRSVVPTVQSFATKTILGVRLHAWNASNLLRTFV